VRPFAVCWISALDLSVEEMLFDALAGSSEDRTADSQLAEIARTSRNLLNACDEMSSFPAAVKEEAQAIRRFLIEHAKANPFSLSPQNSIPTD
jgi:hypothetical protein